MAGLQDLDRIPTKSKEQFTVQPATIHLGSRCSRCGFPLPPTRNALSMIIAGASGGIRPTEPCRTIAECDVPRCDHPEHAKHVIKLL